MKPNELVSVVVPAYKSRYLEDCLDSILKQTYKKFEIIVIDDCSNDGTLEIIKSYAEKYENIRYIASTVNQGVGASRNKGITAAQGKYIAFLDHDDLWEPEKLKLQMECFNKTPGAGAVYCFCKFINSDEDINRYVCKNTTEELLLHGCEFCMPGSMMIRADIIKQAGMFPEEREISEDLALWLEVSTMTEFLCVPEKLYIHRKHSHHLSSQRTPIADELAVRPFLNKHYVDIGLRKRTEQALLVRRATYYRTCMKLVPSCHNYFRAWLKWPREVDPLKSLVVNIIRWRAATRNAQKWCSPPPK